MALFGLLVPPPQYPPERLDVRLRQLLDWRLVAMLILAACTASGALALTALLSPLLLSGLLLGAPVAGTLLAVLGFVIWSRRGKRAARERAAEAAAADPAIDANWRGQHRAFFSPDTAHSRARRRRAAETVIQGVRPELAEAFNRQAAACTSIAVYGCGILAAVHVGAWPSEHAARTHGL